MKRYVVLCVKGKKEMKLVRLDDDEKIDRKNKKIAGWFDQTGIGLNKMHFAANIYVRHFLMIGPNDLILGSFFHGSLVHSHYFAWDALILDAL